MMESRPPVPLPALYVDAIWRCTTPHDNARDRIGIAFTLRNLDVVRLSLSPSSVVNLVESLAEHYPNIRLGKSIAADDGK